jgi:hypothetical protein
MRTLSPTSNLTKKKSTVFHGCNSLHVDRSLAGMVAARVVDHDFRPGYDGGPGGQEFHGRLGVLPESQGRLAAGQGGVSGR